MRGADSRSDYSNKVSVINRLILGNESSDMLEVLTVPSIDELIERISPVRDEVSAHTRGNYGIKGKNLLNSKQTYK